MNAAALSWIANLSLALIGMAGNVMGPVIPMVVAEYQISLATAGVVFTTQGIGRIAAVALTGSWSDRVGRKPVMRLGGVLMALGAAGFGLAPTWVGQVLSAVVMGAGSGMLDGAANTLIADLHVEKRSLALNRLHVFFGIGSLVGPLIAAFFLGVVKSWRMLYGFVAVLAAAHAFFAQTQNYPAVSGTTGDNKAELKTVRKSVLTSPAFWMLGGIMFTYSGMGGIIVGWVNTYLSTELTAGVFAASIVLTLYSVGLTVGRLIWGGVSERVGYIKTLIICSMGGFAFVGLALVIKVFWWIAVSFWFTGFFLAGLFPTAVAYGTGLFARLTGTVTGYLITMASLGGMLLPSLVGVLSDAAGLGVGMLAAPFFGILQLVFAFLLSKREESERADDTAVQIEI
ncbi:MAG: MFS transporter [Firmicutes bacterium]|mgnify:CR=1 FL=1|nr:MFS transporter [Bacillota bacterium]